MTGLPLFANWKSNSYNLIFVIVDRFIKIVYYKPVKVIINAPKLAKVIIDMVVRHYSPPDSIISNQGAIFMFKFWYLPCYFFDIKQ